MSLRQSACQSWVSLQFIPRVYACVPRVFLCLSSVLPFPVLPLISYSYLSFTTQAPDAGIVVGLVLFAACRVFSATPSLTTPAVMGYLRPIFACHLKFSVQSVVMYSSWFERFSVGFWCVEGTVLLLTMKR
jgi:hypothetical protein